MAAQIALSFFDFDEDRTQQTLVSLQRIALLQLPLKEDRAILFPIFRPPLQTAPSRLCELDNNQITEAANDVALKERGL